MKVWFTLVRSGDGRRESKRRVDVLQTHMSARVLLIAPILLVASCADPIQSDVAASHDALNGNCDHELGRCWIDCADYVGHPLVLSAPGYTYYLSGACTLTEQVQVGAPNVTLDCQGGAIAGHPGAIVVPGRGQSGVVARPVYGSDPTGPACQSLSTWAVDPDIDGFTLRNCEVRDWTAHGIDLRRWAYRRVDGRCEVDTSVGYPGREQLENMAAYEFACLSGNADGRCGEGEPPNGSEDLVPISPEAAQLEDFVEWWPSNVTIENSFVHDNRRNGIFGSPYARGWIVRGDSRSPGWAFGADMSVMGNGGVGIYIERETEGFVISSVYVIANGYTSMNPPPYNSCREGIAIDSSAWNVVEDSLIANNCRGGIYLYKNVGEAAIPPDSVPPPQYGIPRRTRSDHNVLRRNTISGHHTCVGCDPAEFSGVGIWVASRQGWTYSAALDALARGASDGNWYRNIGGDTYFRDWAMWNEILDNEFSDNRISIYIADRETRVERNTFSAPANSSMHDVVIADKPMGLSGVPADVATGCFLEHWGLQVNTTTLRDNTSSTDVAAGSGRQILLGCGAGCNAGAYSCSSMCGTDCWFGIPSRISGNMGLVGTVQQCLPHSFAPSNTCP